MKLSPQISKENSLTDLVMLQKNMKKGLAAQERLIRKFQLLAQSEEDMMPILNLFDCPIALFKKGGVLHRVNQTLMENTDLVNGDIPQRNISFLERITNENFAMLEAAEGVFYGKNALLSQLTSPLELFCKSWIYPVCEDYKSALFFPLPDGEGHIRYGAVMLVK
ncbi:MAG: hypothetical protein ACOYJC_05835 [Christensenellales bacterium]|jgi:hypothetical protein